MYDRQLPHEMRKMMLAFIYDDVPRCASQFTGKERDTETGLDYFGARYYGSSMGRYMSPDWTAIPAPIPYAKPDNPQTMNLYLYVTNNPVSASDPDGHAPPNDPMGGMQDLKQAVQAVFKPETYTSAMKNVMSKLGVNVTAGTSVGGGITQVSSQGEKSYTTPSEPSVSAEITVSKAGSDPTMTVVVSGAHLTASVSNAPSVTVGVTTETTPSVGGAVPEGVVNNAATSAASAVKGALVGPPDPPHPPPPPPPPPTKERQN